MATNRMSRGLVALSASAIATVYMAGYLRTQSADASIGAAAVPTSEPIAVVAAAPAATGVVVVPVAPRATAAPAPTPVPTAGRTAPVQSQPAQGAFKDGTFTGQGSSRRGDVWVSIDIQSGRIANVTITRSTLQYPLRDIAGLPAQVVQRQTAQVDTVSRATYSSQAFKGAVAQALSKAG